MWEYRARPKRTIDGDTIDVEVDLGFGVVLGPIRVRLLGIDCPEIRARDQAERERALDARDFTARWCATAAASGNPWPLRISTEKGDSFGRWLATVTYGRENLGVALIDAGLGVPWEP